MDLIWRRRVATHPGDLAAWWVGSTETLDRLGRGDAELTPRVLVLHGFTGSGRAVGDLVERLGARLGPATSFLVPDLPGHGASAHLTDAGAASVEAAAARLVSMLGDGVPVDVVGYSMGGRVGLTLAALAPERLRSLVTIGARPGLGDPGERRARQAADDELAARMLREGVGAFADRWEALALWEHLAERCDPEVFEFTREVRRSCDADGLAQSLIQGGTGAMEPVDLAGLGVDHLSVVGADDTALVGLWRSLLGKLHPVRTGLPGGSFEHGGVVGQGRGGGSGSIELVEIPDSGHAVHLEQPGPLVEVIKRFWADRTSGD